MKKLMNVTLALAGLMLMNATFTVSAKDTTTIPLAGQWRFQLDQQDAGVTENWAAQTLPDKVKLPGGLTEQGIGDPPSLATKWMGGLQNPGLLNKY